MDVWGEVLLIVYGLPPAIVIGVALIARLAARLSGKRLGWGPALAIGVVVLIVSIVAYVKFSA